MAAGIEILAEHERLQSDIRRLKQAAKQNRDWADKVEASKIGRNPKKEETSIGTRSFIGEKSKRMQQRRKNLERRQGQALEEKQELLKNIEETERLKLLPLHHHANRLLTLEQVAVCYGDSQICQEINIQVQQGDRMSLQGKNGCGKSSILKLILGETGPSHTGTIRRASGLVISYVSQETSHLSGSLKDYGRANGIEDSLFLALLRKLDFSRAQFEKPMETYSEGQKKKVLLARSLCEQAHLYLWDEPLNFIDVYSRMQIEELILTFQPTMILVEHDEVFTGKVATKTVKVLRKEDLPV